VELSGRRNGLRELVAVLMCATVHVTVPLSRAGNVRPISRYVIFKRIKRNAEDISSTVRPQFRGKDKFLS